MLGTLVSLVASTMNDQAGMDQLTRQADAHPDDVLAQFMAGVAVHYHGHVQAQSYDEKRRLYARAIPYLERTMSTYSFEPRVYLYLAISHFRLGRQAEAQRLIEQAIPLAVNDPDVFYCRGEIYQRVDLPRAIADVQHYLDMVEQLHAQGVPLNPEKHARVQRMLAALQAVQRGERTLPENDALFDPIRENHHGSPPRLWRSFTQTRSFALITLAVALVGAIVFWLFGRAARR
jgi:tetratricopeptide (TPR) repeat protein